MAYGICDVPQCEEQSCMAWKPLTEHIGRQICESHWNAHKSGTFSLYAAFGFEIPSTARIVKMKDYCACGKELKQGRQVCNDCAVDRERWNEELLPVDDTILRDCPDCHEPKLKPRQRYCPDCKKKRRLKTKREYQKNFRRNHRVST